MSSPQRLVLIMLAMAVIAQAKLIDLRINMGGETVDGFSAEEEVLELDESYAKMRYHGEIKASGDHLNVFRTQRFSRYEDLVIPIPVPDGVYTVTMLFSETWSGAYGPGKRVFDVYLGSKPGGIVKVLDQFDAFRSGGPAGAVRRKFEYIATQGGLTIALRPIVQNPQIAGVMVQGYSYSNALLEDLPTEAAPAGVQEDFSVLDSIGPRPPSDPSLLYDPALNPKFRKSNSPRSPSPPVSPVHASSLAPAIAAHPPASQLHDKLSRPSLVRGPPTPPVPLTPATRAMGGGPPVPPLPPRGYGYGSGAPTTFPSAPVGYNVQPPSYPGYGAYQDPASSAQAFGATQYGGFGSRAVYRRRLNSVPEPDGPMDSGIAGPEHYAQAPGMHGHPVGFPHSHGAGSPYPPVNDISVGPPLGSEHFAQHGPPFGDASTMRSFEQSSPFGMGGTPEHPGQMLPPQPFDDHLGLPPNDAAAVPPAPARPYQEFPPMSDRAMPPPPAGAELPSSFQEAPGPLGQEPSGALPAVELTRNGNEAGGQAAPGLGQAPLPHMQGSLSPGQGLPDPLAAQDVANPFEFGTPGSPPTDPQLPNEHAAMTTGSGMSHEQPGSLPPQDMGMGPLGTATSPGYTSFGNIGMASPGSTAGPYPPSPHLPPGAERDLSSQPGQTAPEQPIPVHAIPEMQPSSGQHAPEQPMPAQTAPEMQPPSSQPAPEQPMLAQTDLEQQPSSGQPTVDSQLSAPANPELPLAGSQPLQIPAPPAVGQEMSVVPGSGVPQEAQPGQEALNQAHQAVPDSISQPLRAALDSPMNQSPQLGRDLTSGVPRAAPEGMAQSQQAASELMANPPQAASEAMSQSSNATPESMSLSLQAAPEAMQQQPEAPGSMTAQRLDANGSPSTISGFQANAPGPANGPSAPSAQQPLSGAPAHREYQAQSESLQQLGEASVLSRTDSATQHPSSAAESAQAFIPNSARMGGVSEATQPPNNESSTSSGGDAGMAHTTQVQKSVQSQVPPSQLALSMADSNVESNAPENARVPSSVNSMTASSLRVSEQPTNREQSQGFGSAGMRQAAVTPPSSGDTMDQGLAVNAAHASTTPQGVSQGSFGMSVRPPQGNSQESSTGMQQGMPWTPQGARSTASVLSTSTDSPAQGGQASAQAPPGVDKIVTRTVTRTLTGPNDGVVGEMISQPMGSLKMPMPNTGAQMASGTMISEGPSSAMSNGLVSRQFAQTGRGLNGGAKFSGQQMKPPLRTHDGTLRAPLEVRGVQTEVGLSTDTDSKITEKSTDISVQHGSGGSGSNLDVGIGSGSDTNVSTSGEQMPPPGIHGNGSLDGLCLHNSTHCSCGMVEATTPEECLFVVNENSNPMICVRRPCSGKMVCACAPGANMLCKHTTVKTILVATVKHGDMGGDDVILCKRDTLEDGVHVLMPMM